MGEQVFTLEQKDIDQLDTVEDVKVAMADIANDPRLTKIKKLNLQAQVIEKLKEIARKQAAKKVQVGPDNKLEQEKKRNKSGEEGKGYSKLGELMQTKFAEIEAKKHLEPLTKDNYDASLGDEIMKDKIKEIEIFAENIDEIVSLFVAEMEEWAEQHDAYGSGYMLADKINELCRYFVQRVGLSFKKDCEVAEVGAERSDVPDWEDFAPEDVAVSGEVIFLKEKVPYVCNGDGWGFNITDYTGLEVGIKRFMKSYMFSK